ncbi:hypothetical protein AVEN_37960-1 [Araneus ventricosus]|uniref:Uncharacterized protein n=1 Tax=Araneus ventricosus TaxID=182803 RepID=A0A4Y2PS34_ARAVE|nr:hypothetical protein AVEN_37960-1 [Araneus ventricosus]
MKFGTNKSKWWNLKELKFQTQSADSNLRPRLEGSGTSKDLPTLGPRVESRNETRNPPCGEEENGWPFNDHSPNCLLPLWEQQPAEIRSTSIEVAWPVIAGLGIRVLNK